VKTLTSLAQLKECRTSMTGSVGFVPTMGALHAGHAELMKRARAECDHVIVSIFVNPTQFNQTSDFDKYPKTLAADTELAKNCGVDVVWTPKPEEIYADAYRYKISETELSLDLCGLHRPGHFDGVLTVVLKLFQLTRPERAYFGEKDYQQLMLVKGMVDAFFAPVQVIGVSTLRDSEGLALSSRNLRLSSDQLKLAQRLNVSLKNSESAEAARSELQNLGFKVDYVEDKVFGPSKRRLAAVFVGDVRLIDNIELESESVHEN
jgi:pantoate--beta-alanine ligase